MGKIRKGILGGFAGKVGTVIGSTWKGIDYMRSLPGKRKAASSQKQVEQQAKFGLVAQLIQSLKDVIVIGFKDQAVRKTEVNSALAYTLKNAVTGTYPGFTVDYSQVKVSRGSLPNAVSPTAEAATDNTIFFNWTDNSGMGKAKAGDKAILVAYCEALDHTLYSVEGERNAENGILPVAMFTGQVVHTWISFLSMDGKDVASSIYTGRLTINP